MAEYGDYLNDDYVPPPNLPPKALRRESIQATRATKNRVIARPRGENAEEWMRRAIRMSRFWIEEAISVPLQPHHKGYAAQREFRKYGQQLCAWDKTTSGRGNHDDDDETGS